MAGHVRRTGTFTALLGLLLATIGLIASAAPVAAAETEGQICNNQQNRPEKDCVGDKAHGTITSAIVDGDLVFDLEANDGFPGWRQLYVCVGTGDTPTNGADCQGSTPTVVSPDDYAVTVDDPAGTEVTEHDKDVTFSECATSITAVVDASAVPEGEFNWIIHVNSCEGTTDEAFGTAGSSTAETYACAAPTGVTADAATLRGATSDEAVEAVEFQLTSPTTGTAIAGTEGDEGSWSAAVSGLEANTAYTYDVRFLVGEEPVGSAEDCEFATTKGPDTYACAAPTNVTATSATLRGSTSDESVDAAAFTRSGSSTALAGTETGNSNNWTAEATGLTPDTEYSYTVDFKDGSTVQGTGSGPACSFKTLASTSVVVTETITPTVQETEVRGVVLEAPAPDVAVAAAAAEVAPAAAVAPAVLAAPLARTGVATDVLLPVGFGLVLFGVVFSLLGRRQELVLIRRPAGEHYL